MEKIQISVFSDFQKGRISKYLYSHFAENLGRCFYEGIWVGEDSEIPNDGGIRTDVTEALKKLELACLRLPGGNFADNYHWQDGIGQSDKRSVRYNANWSMTDNNAFGTHEYIKFCNMINTEPYFCVNLGSGTVEEARSWVEYCNMGKDTSWSRLRAENGSPESFNVKFWAVGNESWGAGGRMTPEYYSDLYRQYAYFMHITDPSIKLIASGSHSQLPDWDEIVLQRIRKNSYVDFLGIHAYLGNMPDVNYSDDQYLSIVLQVESLKRYIDRSAGLCRAYSTSDQPIKVALDEWGLWFKEAFDSSGLEQQSTMLNGIFTALCFHMFHEFSEDLYMANGSETINSLHALILTDKDKMCLTPTYYTYKLLKEHKDGTLLESRVTAPQLKISDAREVPAVSVSSSLSKDGRKLHVSLVNISLKDTYEINLSLMDAICGGTVEGSVLSAPNVRDCNIPGKKEKVFIIPLKIRNKSGVITFEMPPHSIGMVNLDI